MKVLDVKGLCPAHILQTLHAHAKRASGVDYGDLTLEDALEHILFVALINGSVGILQTRFEWDYVMGRPIKWIDK